MPTFGLDDQNLNGVISYFGVDLEHRSGRSRRTKSCGRRANATAAGKQLFELLKCQQCHVLGAIPKDQPTSNLAPDLRMAPERLQPDWILDWLKKPSDILPGTRMPAFWPRLSQVVLPAVWAATPRRRSARFRDPSADVPRRPEPEGGRRRERNNRLGRRGCRRAGRAGRAGGSPPSSLCHLPPPALQPVRPYNRPECFVPTAGRPAPRPSHRLHRRQRSGHRRRRNRRGEQRLDVRRHPRRRAPDPRSAAASNIQDGTVVHAMTGTHPTTHRRQRDDRPRARSSTAARSRISA